MNEHEVISNIGALLPNHIELSLLLVNPQILHHHKCIGKRISDVSMIDLKLGNYIYSHKAQFPGNFG